MVTVISSSYKSYLRKELNANNESESVKTADITVSSGVSFSIRFPNKIHDLNQKKIKEWE
jgi:hypothetical protein